MRSVTLASSLAALCFLPHAFSLPLNQPVNCRRALSSIIQTPKGQVRGVATASSITRYTLPYAKPPARFQDAQPVTSWTGVYDASELKPACPQRGGLVTNVAEDCLYLNLYAPSPSPGPAPTLPVFVWIHGAPRSINDPGLDGSTLASKGVIVITIEYRGGVFGALSAPSLGLFGNQGLKDLIMSLTWIQDNIAAWSGDKRKVTVAGHSTGASLVSTLLATPSADSLFSRVIIQSGPLNYGDQSPSVANALGSLFTSRAGCSTLACLQQVSVDTLLDAADWTVYDATSVGSPAYLPSVASAEPFRPVVDGTLVKGNLVKGNIPLTRTDRAFMLTTTRDEAGQQISTVSASFSQDGQPGAIDEAYYDYIVTYLLTPEVRSSAVLDSGLYEVDGSDADGVRKELSILGTDYVWTCANQQVAVNATLNGATSAVYLAQFQSGIQYISNQDVAFCQGKTCHEDEILAVFGNSLSPLSTAQKALQNEVVARWIGFIKNGNPNAGAYPKWNPVSSATKLNMLALGSVTPSSATSTTSSILQSFQFPQCQNLWGKQVPFDVQMF